MKTLRSRPVGLGPADRELDFARVHRSGILGTDPRQVARAIAGRNDIIRLDHNSRVTAAYYGGLTPHAKKTPKLSDLIAPPNKRQKRKRRQTVDQQVAVARQWTAAIEARSKRKPHGRK